MRLDSSNATNTRKAIVIGGSLAGLFTGNMLRSIGWEVDIYERSKADLSKRGAGIVLQPAVASLFQQVGIDIDAITIRSRDRVVYTPNGYITDRYAANNVQTSWGALYRAMYANFPEENYHQGKTLEDIACHGDSVTAIFADGSCVTGDLLIGADGGQSTVRAVVNPFNRPNYAGYIAWRGMVQGKELPAQARELLGHFASSTNVDSHILGYTVPTSLQLDGDEQDAYNWVWYRPVDQWTELPDLMTDKYGISRPYSVPPGRMTDGWRAHMHRDAAALLPPVFTALVQATKQPFAQAILDLSSEHLVYNRVLLLGEAAFLLRPHLGVGTAKAADDALVLGTVLAETDNDIDAALSAWQLSQLALGNRWQAQGIVEGQRLMAQAQPVLV